MSTPAEGLESDPQDPETQPPAGVKTRRLILAPKSRLSPCRLKTQSTKTEHHTPARLKTQSTKPTHRLDGTLIRIMGSRISLQSVPRHARHAHKSHGARMIKLEYFKRRPLRPPETRTARGATAQSLEG